MSHKTTKSWLLSEVNNFLEAHPEIEANSFGWKSIKDVSLVTRLRDGGDVTTEKLDKIIAFIFNYNRSKENG